MGCVYNQHVLDCLKAIDKKGKGNFYETDHKFAYCGGAGSGCRGGGCLCCNTF